MLLARSSRLAVPLWPAGPAYRGPILLASGHRPFFLLCGLYATLALPMWLLAWRGLLPLTSAWHGHEMIFGVAVAAIAGFLQAAVPKWTSTAPLAGAPVGLLSGLWVLGRVGMWVPGFALLDLVFLPVLAVIIGRPIVHAGNRRNYAPPLMLLGLAALNVAFHLGHAAEALRLATYLVTALIALIAGRIVPAFTQNHLRMAGDPSARCETPLWLDRLAVPVVLAVLASEFAVPASPTSGVAALLASLVLGARMFKWRTFETLGMPIVWILHAGYAFIPLGYFLKFVSDLGGPIGSFAALHALTAGAIGVMILAVASRAALGHSGRALVVSPMTIVSYVLVITGALLRVAAPHPLAIVAAGILWSLGYGIFSIVYWPILMRPRTDGQPG